MYRNSPPLCTIVLQIPSLMPLKMRKVQFFRGFFSSPAGFLRLAAGLWPGILAPGPPPPDRRASRLSTRCLSSAIISSSVSRLAWSKSNSASIVLLCHNRAPDASAFPPSKKIQHIRLIKSEQLQLLHFIAIFQHYFSTFDDVADPLLPNIQWGGLFQQARNSATDILGGSLHWTLRISSGVSKGIDKSVVQGGRDFPYIRVGGGQ